MKFEELSKKHQEFLMYCLSDYIKGKLKSEEREIRLLNQHMKSIKTSSISLMVSMK